MLYAMKHGLAGERKSEEKKNYKLVMNVEHDMARKEVNDQELLFYFKSNVRKKQRGRYNIEYSYLIRPGNTTELIEFISSTQ